MAALMDENLVDETVASWGDDLAVSSVGEWVAMTAVPTAENLADETAASWGGGLAVLWVVEWVVMMAVSTV